MSMASLADDHSKKISKRLQTIRKKRTPHKKISPLIEWPGMATDEFPDISWSEWQTHLVQRPIPVAISELFPSCHKTSVLFWGIVPTLRESGTVDLVDVLHRACRFSRSGKSSEMQLVNEVTGIESWLDSANSREPEIGLALECLSLTHALPELSIVLGPEEWWSLLGRLVQLSVDSRAISLDEQPLIHQLMAGELALTLHFSFPEIGFQQDLWSQGREELTRGPIDLLDGEGLFHVRHLPLLRPMLACWTRVINMGEALGKSPLRSEARVQYEWLVRQAVRLTRNDGTQALSGRSTGSWCPELFDMALDHSDDPSDDKAARMSLPGRRPKQGSGRFTEMPNPMVHSEWAELTLLRSSWKPKSERLTVAHANRSIYGELEASGMVLWSGLWEPRVQADGQQVRLSGDWEVVCWFSDNDGDYLELEVQCENDFTFQRQFFLARQDRFLYVADAISGDRVFDLEYECQLYLGPDVSFAPDPEATEGFLVNDRGQPLAHCFPLALPEWRSACGVGSLVGEDGCLQLRQQVQAQRLYAPLWFNLDPRRMGNPITWRQLTVAEKLERVSLDQAVGYRVQVGKKQWLIYRTFTPGANRTVLGQNLTSDCLIARFRRDGSTETLVEIE